MKENQALVNEAKRKRDGIEEEFQHYKRQAVTVEDPDKALDQPIVNRRCGRDHPILCKKEMPYLVINGKLCKNPNAPSRPENPLDDPMAWRMEAIKVLHFCYHTVNSNLIDNLIPAYISDLSFERKVIFDMAMKQAARLQSRFLSHMREFVTRTNKKTEFLVFVDVEKYAKQRLRFFRGRGHCDGPQRCLSTRWVGRGSRYDVQGNNRRR